VSRSRIEISSSEKDLAGVGATASTHLSTQSRFATATQNRTLCPIRRHRQNNIPLRRESLFVRLSSPWADAILA
jgi:hypothetical protein